MTRILSVLLAVAALFLTTAWGDRPDPRTGFRPLTDNERAPRYEPRHNPYESDRQRDRREETQREYRRMEQERRESERSRALCGSSGVRPFGC